MKALRFLYQRDYLTRYSDLVCCLLSLPVLIICYFLCYGTAYLIGITEDHDAWMSGCSYRDAAQYHEKGITNLSQWSCDHTAAYPCSDVHEYSYIACPVLGLIEIFLGGVIIALLIVFLFAVIGCCIELSARWRSAYREVTEDLTSVYIHNEQ